MTTTFVMNIGRETLVTALLVAGPIMLVGFCVGLFLSLIQAIMQLQEATISFVPKMIAMGATLFLSGHWMLNHLMAYAKGLLGGFGNIVGG